MRNLVLLAALTCGALLYADGPVDGKAPASADTAPGYSFDGQLGFRSSTGEFIPVVPDAVLVGWGDGKCQFTLQAREDLHVDADGSFRLSVAEESIGMTRMASLHPDGSTDPPTCFESVSWPCYRFRAAGCEDRALEFGPKPPNRIVELNCPSRGGSRLKLNGRGDR
jgi:hypothetical protein